MSDFYKQELLKAYKNINLSGFQNEIWVSCPVPSLSLEVQTHFLLSYLVIALHYLCQQPFLTSGLAKFSLMGILTDVLLLCSY